MDLLWGWLSWVAAGISDYQKAFVANRIGFEEGWNSTKGRIGDPARRSRQRFRDGCIKENGACEGVLRPGQRPEPGQAAPLAFIYAMMLSSPAPIFL
ncbi:MAG TPA: hypothetical protein VGJ92_04905 [Methanocella sp.]